MCFLKYPLGRTIATQTLFFMFLILLSTKIIKLNEKSGFFDGKLFEFFKIIFFTVSFARNRGKPFYTPESIFGLSH